MLEGTALLRCVACAATTPAELCETAKVHCNLRRFRDQEFAVWRCPSCRSLHARDPVSLDFYYRDYLSFGPELDAQLANGYQGQLTRLERAGLTRDHDILDYGCGSGSFIRFLRKRGFTRAVGYDAYVQGHNDPSVLDRTYDCVFSQDVLEHVEDPIALLREFSTWAKPSGLIVIGTPEASAIDLRRPNDFIHALHMPYHRHILSADALRAAGEQLGWKVAHSYRTGYGNRLLPGQNTRFGLYYLRCHDDCLDPITEPLNARNWRLYTPQALFLFFFGYFFDLHTDATFMFRTALTAGARSGNAVQTRSPDGAQSGGAAARA